MPIRKARRMPLALSCAKILKTLRRFRKKALELIEEAFSIWMIFWHLSFIEGFEQLFLFRRKLDRGFHDDVDEKISFALSVHIAKTFAIDSDHLSRLNAFR